MFVAEAMKRDACQSSQYWTTTDFARGSTLSQPVGAVIKGGQGVKKRGHMGDEAALFEGGFNDSR